MKKKLYRKIIAVLLITTQFVTSDLSNAFAQSKPVASLSALSVIDVQKLDVSEKWGRIQTRVKGKSDKTLLLIEDAHAVASAQKSIWNLIDEFHKRDGSFALHLEGLAEAPSLALEHSFPDREWLRKKIEADVQSQNISGGAAALILSESLKAQASESQDLYLKSVQLYQQALVRQASVLKQLERAEEIVKKSKQKSYSKEALEWDRYLTEDSMEGLQPILEVPESILAGQFPHLKSVRHQVQNQNYLKRPVVVHFWKRLLDNLKKQAKTSSARLALSSLQKEFGLGHATVSQSAQKLESILHAEVISGLGLLEKRLYVLALQSAKEWQEIKTAELAAEYQKFLIQKVSSLLTKSAQHLLLKQTLRIQLLKKLVRMELSVTEWEKVKVMRLDQSEWNVFKEFYSIQFQREQKMLKQIGASFNAANTVVYVTGGFHRTDLEKMAREQGWNFAVVTPAIASLDGADRYAELMQGNVGWRSHMKVVNGQVDLQKAYWSYLIQAYAKEHPDQIYDLLLNWRKRLILRLADLNQLNQAVEIAATIHAWLAEFMPEFAKQKIRTEWLQYFQNLRPQAKVNTLPSSMTQSPFLLPFGTVPADLIVLNQAEPAKTDVLNQAVRTVAEESYYPARAEQITRAWDFLRSSVLFDSPDEKNMDDWVRANLIQLPRHYRVVFVGLQKALLGTGLAAAIYSAEFILQSYKLTPQLTASFLITGILGGLVHWINHALRSAHVMRDFFMTHQVQIENSAQVIETPSSEVRFAESLRSEVRKDDFDLKGRDAKGIEQKKIDESLDVIRGLTDHVTVTWGIPAYNEIERLHRPSARYPAGEDAFRVKFEQLQMLREINPQFHWRMIYVDDGSPDMGTVKLLKRLRKSSKLDPRQVQILRMRPDEKRGPKGGAVHLGLKAALNSIRPHGKHYIGYTDMDVSANLLLTGLLIKPMAETVLNGAAIGVRRGKGSYTEGRNWQALISSLMYNWAIRLLLPPIANIRDTQAGFKIFSPETLRAILPVARDFSFSFDSELLLLAALNKKQIAQVPIAWFDSVAASTFAAQSVNRGFDALKTVAGVHATHISDSRRSESRIQVDYEGKIHTDVMDGLDAYFKRWSRAYRNKNVQQVLIRHERGSTEYEFTWINKENALIRKETIDLGGNWDAIKIIRAGKNWLWFVRLISLGLFKYKPFDSDPIYKNFSKGDAIKPSVGKLFFLLAGLLGFSSWAAGQEIKPGSDAALFKWFDEQYAAQQNKPLEAKPPYRLLEKIELPLQKQGQELEPGAFQLPAKGEQNPRYFFALPLSYLQYNWDQFAFKFKPGSADKFWVAALDDQRRPIRDLLVREWSVKDKSYRTLGYTAGRFLDLPDENDEVVIQNPLRLKVAYLVFGMVGDFGQPDSKTGMFDEESHPWMTSAEGRTRDAVASSWKMRMVEMADEAREFDTGELVQIDLPKDIESSSNLFIQFEPGSAGAKFHVLVLDDQGSILPFDQARRVLPTLKDKAPKKTTKLENMMPQEMSLSDWIIEEPLPLLETEGHLEVPIEGAVSIEGIQGKAHQIQLILLSPRQGANSKPSIQSIRVWAEEKLNLSGTKPESVKRSEARAKVSKMDLLERLGQNTAARWIELFQVAGSVESLASTLSIPALRVQTYMLRHGLNHLIHFKYGYEYYFEEKRFQQIYVNAEGDEEKIKSHLDLKLHETDSQKVSLEMIRSQIQKFELETNQEVSSLIAERRKIRGYYLELGQNLERTGRALYRDDEPLRLSGVQFSKSRWRPVALELTMRRFGLWEDPGFLAEIQKFQNQLSEPPAMPITSQEKPESENRLQILSRWSEKNDVPGWVLIYFSRPQSEWFPIELVLKDGFFIPMSLPRSFDDQGKDGAPRIVFHGFQTSFNYIDWDQTPIPDELVSEDLQNHWSLSWRPAPESPMVLNPRIHALLNPISSGPVELKKANFITRDHLIQRLLHRRSYHLSNSPGALFKSKVPGEQSPSLAAAVNVWNRKYPERWINLPSTQRSVHRAIEGLYAKNSDEFEGVNRIAFRNLTTTLTQTVQKQGDLAAQEVLLDFARSIVNAFPYSIKKEVGWKTTKNALPLEVLEIMKQSVEDFHQPQDGLSLEHLFFKKMHLDFAKRFERTGQSTGVTSLNAQIGDSDAEQGDFVADTSPEKSDIQWDALISQFYRMLTAKKIKHVGIDQKKAMAEKVRQRLDKASFTVPAMVYLSGDWSAMGLLESESQPLDIVVFSSGNAEAVKRGLEKTLSGIHPNLKIRIVDFTEEPVLDDPSDWILFHEESPLIFTGSTTIQSEKKVRQTFNLKSGFIDQELIESETEALIEKLSRQVLKASARRSESRNQGTVTFPRTLYGWENRQVVPAVNALSFELWRDAVVDRLRMRLKTPADQRASYLKDKEVFSEQEEHMESIFYNESMNSPQNSQKIPRAEFLNVGDVALVAYDHNQLPGHWHDDYTRSGDSENPLYQKDQHPVIYRVGVVEKEWVFDDTKKSWRAAKPGEKQGRAYSFYGDTDKPWMPILTRVKPMSAYRLLAARDAADLKSFAAKRSEARQSLLNHPLLRQMIRRELARESTYFMNRYESRLKRPEHLKAGSKYWLYDDDKIALAVNEYAEDILKGGYYPLTRFEIKQYRKALRSQNPDYYTPEEVPFYLERRQHYGLLNDPDSLQTQNPGLYKAAFRQGYEWNNKTWARSELRLSADEVHVEIRPLRKGQSVTEVLSRSYGFADLMESAYGKGNGPVFEIKRINSNDPNTVVIAAADSQNKLVGYFVASPFKSVRSKTFLNPGLTSQDLGEVPEKKAYYVHSTIIHPDYQQSTLLWKMWNAFRAELNRRHVTHVLMHVEKGGRVESAWLARGAVSADSNQISPLMRLLRMPVNRHSARSEMREKLKVGWKGPFAGRHFEARSWQAIEAMLLRAANAKQLDVLYVDLDNTTFSTRGWHGSEGQIQYLIQKLADKLGGDAGARSSAARFVFPFIDKMHAWMKKNGYFEPASGLDVEFYQQLQRKGVRIVAVTARPEKIRAETIATTTAIFGEGAISEWLFTDGAGKEKLKAIQKHLRSTGVSKDHAILVDDFHENVEAVDALISTIHLKDLYADEEHLTVEKYVARIRAVSAKKWLRLEYALNALVAARDAEHRRKVRELVRPQLTEAMNQGLDQAVQETEEFLKRTNLRWEEIRSPDLRSEARNLPATPASKIFEVSKTNYKRSFWVRWYEKLGMRNLKNQFAHLMLSHPLYATGRVHSMMLYQLRHESKWNYELQHWVFGLGESVALFVIYDILLRRAAPAWVGWIALPVFIYIAHRWVVDFYAVVNQHYLRARIDAVIQKMQARDARKVLKGGTPVKLNSQRSELRQPSVQFDPAKFEMMRRYLELLIMKRTAIRDDLTDRLRSSENLYQFLRESREKGFKYWLDFLGADHGLTFEAIQQFLDKDLPALTGRDMFQDPAGMISVGGAVGWMRSGEFKRWDQLSESLIDSRIANYLSALNLYWSKAGSAKTEQQRDALDGLKALYNNRPKNWFFTPLPKAVFFDSLYGEDEQDLLNGQYARVVLSENMPAADRQKRVAQAMEMVMRVGAHVRYLSYRKSFSDGEQIDYDGGDKEINNAVYNAVDYSLIVAYLTTLLAEFKRYQDLRQPAPEDLVLAIYSGLSGDARRFLSVSKLKDLSHARHKRHRARARIKSFPTTRGDILKQYEELLRATAPDLYRSIQNHSALREPKAHLTHLGAHYGIASELQGAAMVYDLVNPRATRRDYFYDFFHIPSNRLGREQYWNWAYDFAGIWSVMTAENDLLWKKRFDLAYSDTLQGLKALSNRSEMRGANQTNPDVSAADKHLYKNRFYLYVAMGAVAWGLLEVASWYFGFPFMFSLYSWINTFYWGDFAIGGLITSGLIASLTGAITDYYTQLISDYPAYRYHVKKRFSAFMGVRFLTGVVAFTANIYWIDLFTAPLLRAAISGFVGVSFSSLISVYFNGYWNRRGVDEMRKQGDIVPEKADALRASYSPRSQWGKDLKGVWGRLPVLLTQHHVAQDVVPEYLRIPTIFTLGLFMQLFRNYMVNSQKPSFDLKTYLRVNLSVIGLIFLLGGASALSIVAASVALVGLTVGYYTLTALKKEALKEPLRPQAFEGVLKHLAAPEDFVIFILNNSKKESNFPQLRVTVTKKHAEIEGSPYEGYEFELTRDHGHVIGHGAFYFDHAKQEVIVDEFYPIGNRIKSAEEEGYARQGIGRAMVHWLMAETRALGYLFRNSSGTMNEKLIRLSAEYLDNAALRQTEPGKLWVIEGSPRADFTAPEIKILSQPKRSETRSADSGQVLKSEEGKLYNGQRPAKDDLQGAMTRSEGRSEMRDADEKLKYWGKLVSGVMDQSLQDQAVPMMKILKEIAGAEYVDPDFIEQIQIIDKKFDAIRGDFEEDPSLTSLVGLRILGMYLLFKSRDSVGSEQAFEEADLACLEELVAKYNQQDGLRMPIDLPTLFYLSRSHVFNSDELWAEISLQLLRLPAKYVHRAVALHSFMQGAHLSGMDKEDSHYEIEVAKQFSEFAFKSLAGNELSEYDREAHEIGLLKLLLFLKPFVDTNLAGRIEAAMMLAMTDGNPTRLIQSVGMMLLLNSEVWQTLLHSYPSPMPKTMDMEHFDVAKDDPALAGLRWSFYIQAEAYLLQDMPPSQWTAEQLFLHRKDDAGRLYLNQIIKNIYARESSRTGRRGFDLEAQTRESTIYAPYFAMLYVGMMRGQSMEQIFSTDDVLRSEMREEPDLVMVDAQIEMMRSAVGAYLERPEITIEQILKSQNKDIAAVQSWIQALQELKSKWASHPEDVSRRANSFSDRLMSQWAEEGYVSNELVNAWFDALTQFTGKLTWIDPCCTAHWPWEVGLSVRGGSQSMQSLATRLAKLTAKPYLDDFALAEQEIIFEAVYLARIDSDEDFTFKQKTLDEMIAVVPRLKALAEWMIQNPYAHAKEWHSIAEHRILLHYFKGRIGNLDADHKALIAEDKTPLIVRSEMRKSDEGELSSVQRPTYNEGQFSKYDVTRSVGRSEMRDSKLTAWGRVLEQAVNVSDAGEVGKDGNGSRALGLGLAKVLRERVSKFGYENKQLAFAKILEDISRETPSVIDMPRLIEDLVSKWSVSGMSIQTEHINLRPISSETVVLAATAYVLSKNMHARMKSPDADFVIPQADLDALKELIEIHNRQGHLRYPLSIQTVFSLLLAPFYHDHRDFRKLAHESLFLPDSEDKAVAFALSLFGAGSHLSADSDGEHDLQNMLPKIAYLLNFLAYSPVEVTDRGRAMIEKGLLRALLFVVPYVEKVRLKDTRFSSHPLANFHEIHLRVETHVRDLMRDLIYQHQNLIRTIYVQNKSFELAPQEFEKNFKQMLDDPLLSAMSIGFTTDFFDEHLGADPYSPAFTIPYSSAQLFLDETLRGETAWRDFMRRVVDSRALDYLPWKASERLGFFEKALDLIDASWELAAADRDSYYREIGDVWRSLEYERKDWNWEVRVPFVRERNVVVLEWNGSLLQYHRIPTHKDYMKSVRLENAKRFLEALKLRGVPVYLLYAKEDEAELLENFPADWKKDGLIPQEAWVSFKSDEHRDEIYGNLKAQHQTLLAFPQKAVSIATAFAEDEIISVQYAPDQHTVLPVGFAASARDLRDAQTVLNDMQVADPRTLKLMTTGVPHFTDTFNAGKKPTKDVAAYLDQWSQTGRNHFNLIGGRVALVDAEDFDRDVKPLLIRFPDIREIIFVNQHMPEWSHFERAIQRYQKSSPQNKTRFFAYATGFSGHSTFLMQGEVDMVIKWGDLRGKTSYSTSNYSPSKKENEIRARLAEHLKPGGVLLQVGPVRTWPHDESLFEIVTVSLPESEFAPAHFFVKKSRSEIRVRTDGDKNLSHLERGEKLASIFNLTSEEVKALRKIQEKIIAFDEWQHNSWRNSFMLKWLERVAYLSVAAVSSFWIASVTSDRIDQQFFLTVIVFVLINKFWLPFYDNVKNMFEFRRTKSMERLNNSSEEVKITRQFALVLGLLYDAPDRKHYEDLFKGGLDKKLAKDISLLYQETVPLMPNGSRTLVSFILENQFKFRSLDEIDRVVETYQSLIRSYETTVQVKVYNPLEGHVSIGIGGRGVGKYDPKNNEPIYEDAPAVGYDLSKSDEFLRDVIQRWASGNDPKREGLIVNQNLLRMLFSSEEHVPVNFDFIASDAVKDFLNALREKGINDVVLLGGGMRDILLHRNIDDFDISVSLDVAELPDPKSLSIEDYDQAIVEASIAKLKIVADKMGWDFEALVDPSKRKPVLFNGKQVQYAGPFWVRNEAGGRFAAKRIFALNNGQQRVMEIANGGAGLLRMALGSDGTYYGDKEDLRLLKRNRFRVVGRPQEIYPGDVVRSLRLKHEFGLALDAVSWAAMKLSMQLQMKNQYVNPQRALDMILPQIKKVQVNAQSLEAANKDLEELGVFGFVKKMENEARSEMRKGEIDDQRLKTTDQDYLLQALGLGAQVASRAELVEWLASKPDWKRLLRENEQALLQAQMARDTERMVELERTQVGIKAKIELRDEADALAQAVLDGSVTKAAPVIFYSADIHDDLIYLVKGLQEAFKNQPHDLNASIVFQSQKDREQFEFDLGGIQTGLHFFEQNAVGLIRLRRVVEDRDWKASAGIFFAPQSFIKILKPEARLRAIDAPKLLHRTVMPAIPKLIRYFATTPEINSQTLLAGIPSFAAHMRYDASSGWTLLESILEALVVLPRTFAISA